MRRKICLCVIFSCLMLFFCNCNNSLEMNGEITYLTDVGNSRNSPTAYHDGYYFMWSDGLLYRGKDLDKLEIICEDVDQFYPYNGKLFFTCFDGAGLLCMNADGTDKQTIIDGEFLSLVVYNDFVYYIDNSGSAGVVSVTGKEQTKLPLGDDINWLLPTDEYLYYINTIEDGSFVYRYSFDDNTVEQIGTANSVYNFFVCENSLYYLNDGGWCDLYSYNLDNGEITQLTHESLITHYSLNVYRNYIIFSDSGNNGNTYALDMKTQNIRKISDAAYNYISVLGDVLITEKGVIRQ